MDIFINIIAMVLTVTEYILFGSIFFLKPINKKINGKLIGIILIAVIISISGFGEAFYWMAPIQIISTFIAVYCILDIDIFTAVKIWLIAFPLLMLIEFIPYLFYMSNFFTTKYIDIISTLVIIAMMLLYYFITKKKYSEEVFFLKNKIWIFVSVELFILFFLLMSFNPLVLNEPDSNATRLGIIVISILCIIILNFLMLRNYNIKNAYKLESEYLDQFNKQQRDYFELLLSKEEETKSFRHDINNELIEIREMLHNNRYNDAEKFISEMSSEILAIKEKAFTIGNETVDIMLNYYLIPVKDKTKVTVSGILGEDIKITHRDMCIIVSNLLKNAVEECEEINDAEKYIKVFAARGTENISFSVENSLGHQISNNISGLPESTKNDKNNHGYGLKNVKKVVEQNEGLFFNSTDDDRFTVEIILKIRK